jgi:hypothetical protein
VVHRPHARGRPGLTAAQHAEIAAYEKLIAQLRQLNVDVLDAGAELARGTIETVLAKSDLELGHREPAAQAFRVAGPSEKVYFPGHPNHQPRHHPQTPVQKSPRVSLGTRAAVWRVIGIRPRPLLPTGATGKVAPWLEPALPQRRSRNVGICAAGWFTTSGEPTE